MHFRNLNEDIDHVLVTEKQLEETVTRIAGEIDRDQRERDSDLLLPGHSQGKRGVHGGSDEKDQNSDGD